MKDEVRKDLCRAVGATYAAVAPDVDWDDVCWAELVMDANRLEMFGSPSDEALEELKRMSWKEMCDFADSCGYW